MEKLDKKFYGEIRKAKDDSIVPDDEWIVFLAKDNAFAEWVYDYRDRCIAMNADREQIDAISGVIERLERWRAAHPERCKVPDAKGEKLLP